MAQKIRYYKQDGTEYDFSKEPEIKITHTSNADMNIGLPNKLTAVEWLVDQFKKQGFLYDLDIEAAKQMEKEQIIYAYMDSTVQFANDARIDYPKTAEQYYKENYKKD